MENKDPYHINKTELDTLEYPEDIGCLTIIGDAIMLTATVYGKYLDIKADVRDRIKQLIEK